MVCLEVRGEEGGRRTIRRLFSLSKKRYAAIVSPQPWHALGTLAIGSAAIPFNIDFVLDNLHIRHYFQAIVSAAVARALIAAGLATACEVQLGYAIGVAEPVSVLIDTEGTGIISADAPAVELDAAMEELRESTRAHLENREYKNTVLPHPYAFNLFSHNTKIDPANDSVTVDGEELRLGRAHRHLRRFQVEASALAPILENHP